MPTTTRTLTLRDHMIGATILSVLYREGPVLYREGVACPTGISVVMIVTNRGDFPFLQTVEDGGRILEVLDADKVVGRIISSTQQSIIDRTCTIRVMTGRALRIIPRGPRSHVFLSHIDADMDYEWEEITTDLWVPPTLFTLPLFTLPPLR